MVLASPALAQRARIIPRAMGLSLLLLIVLLCCRSQSHVDIGVVEFGQANAPHDSLWLISHHGGIQLGYVCHADDDTDIARAIDGLHEASFLSGRFRLIKGVFSDRFELSDEQHGFAPPSWAGFGLGKHADVDMCHATVINSWQYFILLPYWFLTSIVAIVPLRAALKWCLRRRAILAGTCTTCGFDLRAHRPGDKCPECGTELRPTGLTKSA